MKTKEYSLCKVATPNGKIVEDEMDTLNNRALFVVENTNGPVLEFNDVAFDLPIRLRNSGVEGDSPYYYEQYYFNNGKNNEKLTLDNLFKFKLKRI